MDICLLVSGNLGLSVLEHLQFSPYNIKAVFTDRGSDGIKKYCLNKKISTFVGNPRKGKATSFIKSVKCDVLLSVNYLFIIEDDVINIPNKYAINIHGSLLPKYRGRTPHVWAIINGEKKAGVTAHLIDAKVDNGDIIHQITVDIKDSMTGGELLGRYSKLYPKMIDIVLSQVVKDELKLIKQEINKATYFDKRTPESGKIDWSWSKERIRNWIRAQAKPYPGAFILIENKKMIIHNSEYSDLGYRGVMDDGTVLDVGINTVTVKTCNGAIILKEIEFPTMSCIKKGDILK